MRFSRLTFGATVTYHASQDEASKARTAQRSARGTGRDGGSIEFVDVPTDKRGLIGFLNDLEKSRERFAEQRIAAAHAAAKAA